MFERILVSRALGAICLGATLLILSQYVSQFLRDIIWSFAGALLLYAIMDTVRQVNQVLRCRRVRALLGSRALEKQVCLVYPVFSLSPEAHVRLDGLNRQLVYAKPTAEGEDTYRVDLPEAAAVNDIEAMLYATQLVESLPQTSTRVIRDTHARDWLNHPMIIIGLSSNCCTHMYLKSRPAPVFRIQPDGSGSEYLVTGDGTEFPLSDHHEFGIISRDWGDDYRCNAWIVLAGAGPSATPGAAHFFFHNWEKLLKQAGARPFAAVVRVLRNQPKTAQLVHMFIPTGPRGGR